MHLGLRLIRKIKEPSSSPSPGTCGHSVIHSTKNPACALCKNGNQAQTDQGNSTVQTVMPVTDNTTENDTPQYCFPCKANFTRAPL